MPTAHRQRKIDEGASAPHHGHAKRAVKQAAALAAADQKLIDQAEKDMRESQKTAEKAYAARRDARAERHAAEREAKSRGRKRR